MKKGNGTIVFFLIAIGFAVLWMIGVGFASGYNKINLNHLESRYEVKKNFIEQNGKDISARGFIEILHYDDFEDGESSEEYFLISEDGKRYALYFDEIPEFFSGSELSLNGKELDREISVAQVNLINDARPLDDEHPNIGEQKVAVILVKNESTTWEPYTIEEVEDIIFNISNPLSLNHYINEISYGQMWISGDVYGWYTAPPNAYFVYFADNDIDFRNYDKVIKLEYSHVCCGAAALFPTTYFTNDGPVNLTLAINAAIDESGLLGDYSLYVTAHEFGHTLGLAHANYYDCSDGAIGGNCSSVEYGDWFSLMGGGNAYYHFNVGHKEMAGWVNGLHQVKEVTRDGEYTILPLEVLQPGFKGLKIKRDDSLNYVIDFRRRILGDSTMHPQPLFNLDGAFVYLDSYPGHIYPNLVPLYTNMIDFSPDGPPFPPNQGDVVLPVGASFVEPNAGFTLTTLEVNEEYLRVRVDFNECADGVDNDNDGFVDYPDDLDCSSQGDNREGGPSFVSRKDLIR